MKAADIKAIARRWANPPAPLAGSGMRGGFGGACRHHRRHRLCPAHRLPAVAMQGMGKPGRNMWSRLPAADP